MKKFKFSAFRNILSSPKATNLWTKISFLVFGIASTIWFLVRIIPKPSRATYPCMKAAAPVMSGFIVYLLSITGSAFAIKNFRKKVANSRFIAAGAFLIVGVLMLLIANASNQKEASAAPLLTADHFEANKPIGTPSGLKPGRVVWIWDRNSTGKNFKPANNKNSWWAKQTNGTEVNKMLEKALTRYTDKKSTAEAWDALFHYFNEQHGKGSVGYTPGEKIYIKINITNSASSMTKTDGFDTMDATPELSLAMLKQLIEVVGVAQSDIFIGDPFRNFHNLYWDMCHSVYPNVNYCDGLGIEGRHQTVPTVEHVMKFSGSVDKGRLDFRIPQEYVNAAYIINMPCLKTHDQGGITLGAKNHQGSVLQDGGNSTNQYIIDMHPSLPKNNPGYGKYRHIVDYLGHKDVGGKTLVTIIDGIWAGRSWEGYVEKWQMAPFNNDYPSSLFISQDRVAIDAVGYDFLLEEYKSKPVDQQYPYFEGCDDYLYQAADSTYWPADVRYDPEGDGTHLKSMGVYEHWNNPIDKKYSRNLGTGNGIELIEVNMGTDPLTPANSGLVSANVNKIFVDSFDVKWFGTDKGISRYDGEKWTTIDTSNYLRNNKINGFQYEKTSYGHELWVATNGGLSVMSFNVDGVTSATTYYVGGPESGMINDTVTAVGLDKNHTRWIATPQGINTFGAKGWKSVKTYIDGDHETQDWKNLKVNAIGSYDKDASVYMGTSGAGVVRMSYNDVDGFTGASALKQPWSHIYSDTIWSVLIDDTIQWYGNNLGIYEHFGPSTKEYWDFSISPRDGIINPVVKAIEKDNSGNIWIGTEKGLHVITADGTIYKYATGTQSSDVTADFSPAATTLSWTPGNGFTGSMFNEKVNDIRKDFSGNIWIASNTGVEVYKSIPGVLNEEPVKRVVFMTKTTSGTIAPTNGTTYTANSVFKLGSVISGWYCIYNGTGTTVDVTGLTSNTTYRVAVFDYYGEAGHEVYTSAVGINNPNSFTTGNVGKEDLSNISVKVFPIPFNDYLTLQITLNAGKSYQASISNLDGKIIKRITVNGNYQRIETKDLAKGAYLLKISDGQVEKSIKIIK